MATLRSHSRRFFTGLGFALLGLVPALLSSCSYLLGDPYGPIGQRALAISDLDGEVKAETGSDLQQLNRMSFLSSGGHDYLFLFVNTQDQMSWLIALDGENLSVAKSMKSYYYQSGSNLAVDLSGNFVMSSSSGLVLDPSLSIVSTYTLPTGPGCLASDGSYNNSLANSPAASFTTSLSFAQFLNDWTSTGSSNSKSFTSSGTSSYLLLDAATTGGALLLLFADASGQAVEVSYPYGSSIYSALNLSTSIIDAAPHKSASVAYQNQMVWATKEGVVVGGYGNNGLQLELHKLDGGGTASYTLRSNGSSDVYFEPSGSYFFYFDRSLGRLYKMRTWW